MGSYIPLEDAKSSIIRALSEYHPELGARANAILNSERLNLIEEPYPKTKMMQCRPAGVDHQYLKDHNMIIPDFADRFGPHFTDQTNTADKAIIDYEYVGTKHSVLYLAHELGHAIADDIQNESGHSFKDFSAWQAEEQAYFIQNIFLHFEGTHSPETEGLKKENSSELSMSWQRAAQFKNAHSEFSKTLAMAPDERMSTLINALGGNLETKDAVTPISTAQAKCTL